MRYFLLAWTLFGAQIARADALFDAMMGWKTDSYKESKSTACPTPNHSDDYGYDRAEPEHYSWDDLYLDPYENLEIIIDPYGDLEEESEDD